MTKAREGGTAAVAGTSAPTRLLPRPDTVTVRLYRIGHGDCFLLAFATADPHKPTYVLVDCGYKPGSPAFLGTTPRDIVADIRRATGGHIDVVVITHEHQDHVNGFTAENFKGITFGECWFAWTENPDDALAVRLRKRFADRLTQLQVARKTLAAAASDGAGIKRIDSLLAFELGDEAERGFGITLAADGTAQSANQRALALVRSLAGGRARYLEPHGKALTLQGAERVRVFALGPPKDEKLLHSLDPKGDEGFPEQAFAKASVDGFFVDALRAGADDDARTGLSPFLPRYSVAFGSGVPLAYGSDFAAEHYGRQGVEAVAAGPEEDEVPDNAPWRRIDHDWLQSAEELALAMNNDTNNGSLVLAIELGEGGKVLLLAADAQRGNWISWSQGDWRDGERVVTARDLLARTVLYKVGHHGSHNATLHGEADADYPNLAWMAQGDHAAEFAAMLTAVEKWAVDKAGWHHPLPAIKDALLTKTGGRVFQTDTDLSDMSGKGLRTEWEGFLARARGGALYMDYTISY